MHKPEPILWLIDDDLTALGLDPATVTPEEFKDIVEEMAKIANENFQDNLAIAIASMKRRRALVKEMAEIANENFQDNLVMKRRRAEGEARSSL